MKPRFPIALFFAFFATWPTAQGENLSDATAPVDRQPLKAPIVLPPVVKPPTSDAADELDPGPLTTATTGVGTPATAAAISAVPPNAPSVAPAPAVVAPETRQPASVPVNNAADPGLRSLPTPFPPETPMIARTAVPSEPVPPGSEISIILSNHRFYPSQIRLRSGMPTTLVFTTVNKKPAALVIEPLSPQRWVASSSESMDRVTVPTDITRELNSDKVTTISFEPARGRFSFHDALGGARGEIIVE